MSGGAVGAGARTVLQPSTSIWVSSSDHFLRCFLCTTKASWSAILRTLPLRSGMVSMWVSSRNVQAGTRRGDEGRARETRRRCFGGECMAMVEQGDMFLFYLHVTATTTPCPTLAAPSAPRLGQAVLSTHPAVLPPPQSDSVTAHAAAPTLCVLSHPPGPASPVST